MNDQTSYIQWRQDYLVPLLNDGDLENKPIGILGVTAIATNELDDDAVQALSVLGRRAALALRDRHIQQQLFQTLVELTPQVGMIQSLRAAGRYNETKLYLEDIPMQRIRFQSLGKRSLNPLLGRAKINRKPIDPTANC